MSWLVSAAIIDNRTKKKKTEITTYNYYRIHTSSLHFATNNKYHQWYHFSKTTFHHIMRDGYINAEGREGGMIHVCFVFCFVFVFCFCFCFCFFVFFRILQLITS